MGKKIVKIADSYYAVRDERWLQDPAAFIAAYPRPHDVPDDIVEEVADLSDEVKAAAYEISPYGWNTYDGELYGIAMPERVGIRAIHNLYGEPLGAYDAGVAFGFSEAYAAKGLKEMMDNVEEVAEGVYDHTLAALRHAMKQKGDSWNAYENYGVWTLFEHLYGNRFGDSAEYDDGEVWIKDTPVDAITYWSGQNFRTIIVEGLGGEHDLHGIEADIELASPAVHLWADAVSQLCSTRAGERSAGIIIYTADGNMDSLPCKGYSLWQGTGWFRCWLEWKGYDDDEEE
ncbi:MAG: hypothetical protein D6790_06475 [Caldilineae bacterium]|nr:MAG: hypothetical protein D6790_06475 [Caldilineae bacterium]